MKKGRYKIRVRQLNGLFLISGKVVLKTVKFEIFINTKILIIKFLKNLDICPNYQENIKINFVYLHSNLFQLSDFHALFSFLLNIL